MPLNIIVEQIAAALAVRPAQVQAAAARHGFVVARFNHGVDDTGDLRPGILLDGTVSNVAHFGAFVDIGVHQDGLVHVGQLSNRFVADAREVVRAGQVVRVRVVDVDVARRRIALTLKLDAPAEPRKDAGRYRAPARDERTRRAAPPAQGASAPAFAKLRH